MGRSQKRSEVTVKLAMGFRAGSQDIHCKKPARKNTDKGCYRKAGRSLLLTLYGKGISSSLYKDFISVMQDGSE